MDFKKRKTEAKDTGNVSPRVATRVSELFVRCDPHNNFIR